MLARFAPFVLFVSFGLSSCVTNETILRSGKETPPAANVEHPTSSLDDEIAAMRTANFRFIWVIRRKDGGAIDAADKAIIRGATEGVNRRVLADDDRALVIGTNAVPSKENVAILFGNFAVQDLSPEPMPNLNANSNSKKKK
jgi:hypothetical protein